MPEYLFIPMVNGTAVLLMMLALWAASLWLRDASIVDRFWGVGFVVLAGGTAMLADGYEPRQALIVGTTVLWGLRLSGYITWRNWGHGEDYRYQAMRKTHGARFPLVSLVTVFLLQGALLWFISLPLQIGQVADAPAHLTWLDGLGALLWILGLTFESVGDYQLARFKANPANNGKVMDRGLWRYTRHPNYFGDAVVWWGFYLIAAATPAGRWTLLSPVLMTFFLMRVSGVALLEKKLVDARPAYRAYIERTNTFFPGPPRKGAGGSE